MFKIRPTTLASFIVILFGIFLFYIGTDGFTAFTAETARVTKLMEEKPKFPKATLQDSEGRTYTIAEFENQYVFITFMYTGCTTVCIQLEQNMAKVYEKIPREYMGKDIVFLSISFDPERDVPETLQKYKKLFNSDGETWRMATIPDEGELNSLLNRFGVIVIPDGKGNFAHNSAFYLVDKGGQLIDVMDFTDIEGAVNKIIEKISTDKGGQG